MSNRTWALIPFAMLYASSLAAEPARVRTGTNTNRDSVAPVYNWGDYTSTEVHPTDKALAVGRSMAQCVVKNRPAKVQAALLASDEAAFRRAVGQLDRSLSDCMMDRLASAAEAQFAFGPSALAGLLAEALLAQAGTPAPPAVTYNPNAPKLDWLAQGQASLVQLRLAECLAATHPAEVASFVGTKPDSPDEANGLKSLVPFIPACLDKNVTLQAKRSTVRLALALALYRRAAEPALQAQRTAQ